MNKFIYQIACLILGFSLWNCKPLELAQEDAKKKLPRRWDNTSDSASHTQVAWQQFFADEHLKNLIDTALRNNFEVLAMLQRVEASRAQVGLAKGSMLPTIAANVSAAQRRFGLYTMDGAGNATTPINGEELVPVNLPDYYLGLLTSWEMDIWGKLRARKVSSLSRYLSTVEGRNLVVTNLVADVAASYYELLSLDVQLDIIRETIRLQENALTLTTVQKEAGVANKLAVEQFQAQVLNSKALEKDIQQSIVETESKINFLLGRYPQPIERDKNSFLSANPVNPHVGVPSDLLRHRPDVRQAEYELMASNADVKAARAAFLPSLNITGAYGFQAYKTSFLFTAPESIAYGIIGSLTAPLINRAAIKSEFNISKASQLEAFYNYQSAIVNGYVEVYNQLSNIRNLSEVYQLKSQQADVLTESIETSSDLFGSRRATYLEVIAAQGNALQAKLELVDVKRRQFDSSIYLYKALGGGWMQSEH